MPLSKRRGGTRRIKAPYEGAARARDSPESDMSQKEIVDETKTKLQELEQRIRAARVSPSASDNIVAQAHKDWDDMVRSHADISRRLNAADNHSAEALEGIRLDIDVLRNSFERWMSRVEGNFSKDK